MIIFLDENDVEYGALATIKATNAVNGERSITGEIISGDVVLSRIERGWRLRFEDEYYVVTYAKPIDEGKNVQVSFDAVHQFFWDFGKSSVYDQLDDGSHTFRTYLDFVFDGSGYTYDIETSLMVKAFEKQSFGYKNRLSLFNDIITSSGVEFQVNGKVVRILAKVGTDLSTVVRKNFNLNELGIEKNIGDFVTYQKGFGAYFDEEDHSKGRLIAEYTSPLASVYGKLEADPLVDERYKQQESLLEALKETVDNSYTISVSLDMEDLTRAGYHYTQPVAGDYIMAINETLGFKEKIRIVSFTSEYDVAGQLIKHTVTCNDIGSVKKLSASYTQTQHQAANAEVNANTAYEFANKALVSANGKNTNYYGDTFPVDNPKGTLKKGDLLFLTVGDTVKQYYWNGAEWVTNPVVSDVEAFKEQIAEELKDVPNREEFENKIAEELANSKAEIETQIETAKTQAESNAKEYADTINQETAKVAEQANTAANEIKADLVNVKNNLTATSLVANNAQVAVDEAKQDLTEVANELNTAKQDLANSVTAVNTKVDSTKAELTQAKQDLTSHAQQLQTQANVQTELTKRVTTVETTANGTKTTVNELTKTVAQNGKDITSVTNRTKTVEDDLANTKTTLSQVQTTANSTSQKTATLETGLNGLNAKFENLSVGTTNHFLDSAFETTIQKIGILQNGNVYTPSIDTTEKYDSYNTLKIVCKDSAGVDNPKITYPALAKLKIVQQGKLPDVITISFWGKTDTEGMSLHTRLGYTGYEGSQNVTLATDWKRYIVHVKTNSFATNEWLFKFSKAGTVWIAKPQFEFSAIASDYHLAEEDTSSKVAEYKQTADQNYASLQTTVQNLDGTVQQNKTTAEQTAAGFKTRIESLETYKNSENIRANQYFESAKTETARQLTAERTAIAKDYVAKSTYTSDVTGIRNDLSATTTTANATKTNLANYQASNDKAVANLQSNLQTANGNISSLQTKIEAVPGQITSAVSAVESKIPTNVSTRNLILKSNDFSNPHKQIAPNTTVTSTDDYFVIKSTGYTANAWGGMSWNMSISEVKAGEEFSILMPVYIDSSVPLDNGWAFTLKNHPSNSAAYKYDIPTDKKDQWFNVAITFKTTKDVVFDTYPFYVYLVKNGLVRIKPPMLVRGSLIPSDYQPAFEDTESDITKLSSELTQTKDGMTLLATKTELNTAKSDLQSGVTTATNKANTAQSTADSAVTKANAAQSTANSNAQTISTHTTQISALNTGLQAKVSQTDFNTLSGRVTTAENNITATANELSSKISSVEGMIPTEAGLRNYVLGTGTAKSSTGGKLYDLSSAFDDIADNATLIIEFDWRVTAPTSTSKFRINRVITYSDGTADQWDNAIYKSSLSSDVSTSSGSGHYSGVFTNVAYKSTAVSSRYLNLNQTTASGTVTISNLSIRVGSLKSDWQSAPEDYDSKLATAQSEIKQTTDAITASVSSVQTAASNAQSTANTAVSKADAAQAGVNTLDSTTVKSASLTINTDGIVMKAGKSTTDVANAIGSYFAVNQNAINLFADKIKVKGDMIVDGAITSDKIASKQINTAHLNGKIITADVISSNAVTADAIKAGAVTTDKMSANSINGDRITAGTLDAAKIKAGSITASQIASGTLTSEQIKAGAIKSINIEAGAITSDKIASNSIDASKIVANSITADMITGGKLKSTNGATIFDLNGGTLTFNNNYGYIQRVANDKIFEITTRLSNSSYYSQEYLTSAFNIRKSDNSRQAGVKFTLFNTVENKPTAEAKINADAFILYDSKDTRLFSVHGRSTFFGTFNTQDWGDIPVAEVYGGLLVNDIGIGGHIKSLLNIVEELCKKAGILWV